MEFVGNGLTNFSTTVDPQWFYERNQTPTTIFNGRSNRERELNVKYMYFIVATIVCVFGTIGNIVTMSLFVYQKKIKIPTFTGLFCSSIADTLNLIIRYITIFGKIFSWMTSFPYIYGISAFTYMVSNFHLLIIAIIRYIYISKPFYSLTFTYAKVVYMSVGVWISSFVVAILYSWHIYMVIENYLSNSQSYIIDISLVCLSLFGSLIPISILHIINVVNIRKGLSNSVVNFKKTMSIMLAAVIIISTIANLPTLLLKILNVNNIHTSSEIIYLGNISQMLGCASNPFVFFIFSKTVRKNISRFLAFECVRR